MLYHFKYITICSNFALSPDIHNFQEFNLMLTMNIYMIKQRYFFGFRFMWCDLFLFHNSSVLIWPFDSKAC